MVVLHNLVIYLTHFCGEVRIQLTKIYKISNHYLTLIDDDWYSDQRWKGLTLNHITKMNMFRFFKKRNCKIMLRTWFCNLTIPMISTSRNFFSLYFRETLSIRFILFTRSLNDRIEVWMIRLKCIFHKWHFLYPL